MRYRNCFGWVFMALSLGSCQSGSDKPASHSTSNKHVMKDSVNVVKIKSNDGTTIGLWKSGSGPPLLLIHGTTADHRRWSGILDSFEDHFTVYTMDRRGRGESSDAPEYSIMREAEDVAAVLEYIGDPACVVGHSYGAVCALEGSLLTDKISRLVLYEPPIPTGVPMYPEQVPDEMLVMIDQGENEKALEYFMRQVVRMPDHELEAYRQLPMWEFRIQLAPTIPRELAIDRRYQFEPERFTQFKVPTRFLLGGDSPDLFRRAAKVLDSTLSSCTIDTLPGQQHIAMDTDPDLFLEKTLGFLLE